MFKRKDRRELTDLLGVGKATLGDLHLLGITSVKQLARADAAELHARLEELTGTPQNICVLDVFECSIAQAMDPELPWEECHWFWWSRKRKREKQS